MAKRAVTFKFDIDEKVTTPFGDAGIVAMCAIDDSGNLTYFVKTANDDKWIKEDQLSHRSEVGGPMTR